MQFFPLLSKAIVILAAGVGRRFGGHQHKALVPLLLAEGSLERLLRQLLVLMPGAPICVVAGHRAAQVEVAAQRLSPSIHCVRLPELARLSLLSSLSIGLDSLATQSRVDGAWVLFADTLYHPDVLLRLIRSDADDPRLACQPIGTSSPADAIGVCFDPISQRVDALGPDQPLRQGVMAPAVYWPRRCWAGVKEAASRGLTRQWQLLQQLLSHGSLWVEPLGHGHSCDIDTPEDRNKAVEHLLSPLAVSFFRRTISKDERNLDQHDQIVGSSYRKVCANVKLARIEALALDWLSAAPGCRVPTCFGQCDRTLLLEPIYGIRLYDLLRLLRFIEQLNPEQASQARTASRVLLRRSLEQLLRLQQALLGWPLGPTQPAYPLSSHVAGLLAMVSRLLGLPPLLPAECRELHALNRRWQCGDALIPFRDATAKNTIVVIPELAPGRGLSPAERMAQLQIWLDRAESDSVPLVDIDLTSVVHRTAPEDDLFSLLAHAGSLPVGQQLLAELVPGISAWPNAVAELVSRIDPRIQPDCGRAARALLVRYLRFGGRKLLYRMLNPAAFAVRFRYDDPAFYFLQLPDLLRQLDPEFETSFPLLLARLDQLRCTASLLPSWSDEEAHQDLYRSQLGLGIPYWQESPLEISPASTACSPGR